MTMPEPTPTAQRLESYMMSTAGSLLIWLTRHGWRASQGWAAGRPPVLRCRDTFWCVAKVVEIVRFSGR